MAKHLPIGISDFKKIIEGGYAYADKTLLIQELIEKGAEVALFPRMRRFGKTLNLSMLRYFFEKGEEDTSFLFKELKIWQNEEIRALQGQFPVIFLSLKDVKFATWQQTFEAFGGVIGEEFKRHRYLLEGEILSVDEKDIFSAYIRGDASQVLYAKSLLLLSEWLHRFYKRNVILLIDEYDTPAHAAYVGGYFDTFIIFLRNWLSSGLKDNPFLERGVLTGILRIAKESIFSGLNNISIFTILNENFQDKFGFTESEVKELLEEYNLGNRLEELQKWYNGYRCGSCTGIYNPWSVLSCIAHKGALAPYWVNTSDNKLVKQLLTQGGEELKSQLEPLLKGNTLKKILREDISFTALKNDVDAVWSLLLFTGYLTLQTTPYFENGLHCELMIPNQEVRFLYEDIIKSWFTESINQTNFQLMLKSLKYADIKTFSEIFQDLLLTSMSVHDIPDAEPEKVYHAFVLGLLVSLKDEYEVRSNRESGYGRYDVMLIPKNKEKKGIIFEFKKIRSLSPASLQAGAEEALSQIESKRYIEELKAQKIASILCLGMAFRGKEVFIKEKIV